MKKISAFLKRNKKGAQACATIASGQATPSASTPPVRVPLLAHDGRFIGCYQAYEDNETRSEIMGSLRTVLNLAEKCLDGCPIWGPKAAVAAVSENIETVQVRPAILPGICEVKVR
jgi:hypothetical protein